MYRMSIGIAFTVCIIKGNVGFDFFQFFGQHGPQLTQTSLGGPQKSMLTKFYCIWHCPLH